MAGELVKGKGTKKLGRPSGFSEELADSICAMLAEGKSLRTVLKEENMPSMSMVFRWLAENVSFREQYTRAKEEAADALAEDIILLADEARYSRIDPKGAQVALDAMKWSASKLKPKKYGDKLDLTSDGKQLPTPIYGGVNVVQGYNSNPQDIQSQ